LSPTTCEIRDKIHKACPDGKLELKGVRAEVFELEAGTLFYSSALETARRDFKQLVDMAIEAPVLLLPDSREVSAKILLKKALSLR
jgi:hypothetical protein